MTPHSKVLAQNSHTFTTPSRLLHLQPTSPAECSIENSHRMHLPYTNIQHTSTTLQGTKNTIFNNGRYTTNIPTDPHTHYNRHKNKHAPHTNVHTSIVSTHLATRDNKKYCAHLHHTIAALKKYFPASLVVPFFPNSEQINYPFSNHTYTKSTPNHIHNISSTAHTYQPHCNPWICGQTPSD